MKRFIASLVISASTLLCLTAPVSAATNWRLDVFEPVASTTNKRLNIEYSVVSTDQAATFSVVLKQNGQQIATGTITNPYGDSKVFSLKVPTTGTYTYNLSATNNLDASTQSQERVVKVVNVPNRTLTVTDVQGASTTANSTTPATTSEVANAAAATHNTDGKVSDSAASATNTSNDTASTDTTNDWVMYAGIGVVIAALAGGVYLYRQREQ